MRTEAAIIFVIEIGGFIFFLGLIPLVTVLSQLRGVWGSNKRMGLLLWGVVINTLFLFLVLFAAFVALIFPWSVG